jgi:hypothetical protein
MLLFVKLFHDRAGHDGGNEQKFGAIEQIPLGGPSN